MDRTGKLQSIFLKLKPARAGLTLAVLCVVVVLGLFVCRPLALAALVGCLLATNRILDGGNKFALAFGLAQGWLLAWCIFRDPNNTDAFVFSRPYTRQQVFWSRWMLAMVLQAISIGAIYAILAVGARTWIHGNHLPHYPMVAPFELVVVRTIAFASLIAFHLIMFLSVRSRVLSTGTGPRWKAYVVKLACLMILMVFIGGIPVAAPDGPWRAPRRRGSRRSSAPCSTR